ncbi:hypothetical protein [Lacticigenium naphthae]|uniref:hypothetical protein n=1 Tax=Lacticigenium naphthae TaxID=515351 RepID=UPI0004218851|nr:hypothetical protein [Lacticigenium naphthae]
MDTILTEERFVDRIALQFEEEGMQVERCLTEDGSTLFTIEIDSPSRGSIKLEV